MAAPSLHYVADPMCSWCWGFQRELEKLHRELPAELSIQYVMGGLAVDSDLPMPADVREYVQQAWREVTEHTGAEFNWDFWTECEPRRSTYPSCRAVIAAASLEPTAGRTLFEAIQRAYYQEARNPSLDETLVALAGEIGLNEAAFAKALNSDATHATFRQHRELRRTLGVTGFPSIVLTAPGESPRLLMRGSGTAREILAQL